MVFGAGDEAEGVVRVLYGSCIRLEFTVDKLVECFCYQIKDLADVEAVELSEQRDVTHRLRGVVHESLLDGQRLQQTARCKHKADQR